MLWCMLLCNLACTNIPICMPCTTTIGLVYYLPSSSYSSQVVAFGFEASTFGAFWKVFHSIFFHRRGGRLHYIISKPNKRTNIYKMVDLRVHKPLLYYINQPPFVHSILIILLIIYMLEPSFHASINYRNG
jgi:hypothetical protein